MSVVEDYIDLFQGNTSAVGTEEGGCLRIDPNDWALLVKGHLHGSNTPIGVYPMVSTDDLLTPEDCVAPVEVWRVKWGCIDFDEGEEESWAHAVNVASAASAMGLYGWIERSRSKGYHAWFFSADWVPAVDMRRALLGLAQVVGAPTKEINPKQTTLKPGQLGNYVRLPYPGALTDSFMPERRVVMRANGAGPMSLEHFVEAAKMLIGSAGAYAAVGQELYQEPKPRQRRRVEPSEMAGDPVKRLGGLAYTVWANGPLDGAGRGHTLYKLAATIFEDGQHTAEEAEELLRDSDERWGKFADRGEPEYITKMVDKIWEDTE